MLLTDLAMPIYQYKCEACDHQLEALQKMSDAKLVDCPSCNSPTLKKQLTAAAFKLKGTGWYETDFKNSGTQAASGTDKQSATSDPVASSSESSKSANADSSVKPDAAVSA